MAFIIYKANYNKKLFVFSRAFIDTKHPYFDITPKLHRAARYESEALAIEALKQFKEHDKSPVLGEWAVIDELEYKLKQW